MTKMVVYSAAQWIWCIREHCCTWRYHSSRCHDKQYNETQTDTWTTQREIENNASRPSQDHHASQLPIIHTTKHKACFSSPTRT